MKAPHLVLGVKPSIPPIARDTAELHLDHNDANVLYAEMVAAWRPFLAAFRRWIV